MLCAVPAPLRPVVVVDRCPDPAPHLAEVARMAAADADAREAWAAARARYAAAVLAARRAGVSAPLIAEAAGERPQTITKHTNAALDAEGDPAAAVPVCRPGRRPK